MIVLPHLPANAIEYHGNQFSIALGFRIVQNLSKYIGVIWFCVLIPVTTNIYFLIIQSLVEQYGLQNDLRGLIIYFQHFWMDVVTPQRFTTYGMRHRTNNFVESYHASLLRRMGQHPSLYIFYGKLSSYFCKLRLNT